MRNSIGSTRKCTPDQCRPAPPTPLPGRKAPSCRLGIRPEHLEIASPGQTTLTVTADVGERLGSDTFCHVNLTNGRAELAHGVVAPGALPSTILRGKTTLEILVNGLNGM